MTHTPGPWEAQDTKFGVDVVSKDWRIAVMFDLIPKENTEANARLIAAAPDLLQAVTSLVEALELRGLEHGWHHYPDMLKDARAAIAKATGEP